MTFTIRRQSEKPLRTEFSRLVVRFRVRDTNLVLQHTQYAIQLCHPLFPTHLSAAKLRSFDRHALKRLGPDMGFLSAGSLLLKQSNEPKLLKAFENASELSVCDRGELILAEYSETSE